MKLNGVKEVIASLRSYITCYFYFFFNRKERKVFRKGRKVFVLLIGFRIQLFIFSTERIGFEWFP